MKEKRRGKGKRSSSEKKETVKRKSSTDNQRKSSQHRKQGKRSSEKVQKKKKDVSSNRHKKNDLVEEVEPKRSLLSGVGNLLFYGVLLVIFAGAIFFNFSDNPDKSFFNYRFMSVLTDSMAKVKGVKFEDGFSSGAIIIIKKEEPSNLKKNDIITFYPSRETKEAFLTHRIYKIDKEKLKGKEEACITTKGDANTGQDIAIFPDQVVGKVVYSIPHVGSALDFVRKNIVIVAIFFVMLFASLVTLRYYVQI